MKKPWAKWCLLGMGALFALVGVPILINESYKVGVGYITIWNTADVLSYEGAVSCCNKWVIFISSQIRL